MKKNFISNVVLFLSSFYSIVNPALGATELAKINQSVITLEEFEKKYQENLKFFQYKAPTKRGVLDDLIKRELGILEAKRSGLDKDPEVVDRMNTVLYHALLDKKLAKNFEKINVTEGEARSFYEKNPEIRTSHIFVALPPNASKEQESQALEKITRIKREFLDPGKLSFTEIAQKYSEGVAAPMGGDLDYQTKDKLDPTFYKTALELKTVGRVSRIVRSQFGFHIIKLTGVRSWEEVDRSHIKRLVFDEKRNDIFEEYIGQLRAKYKVTVREELVK